MCVNHPKIPEMVWWSYKMELRSNWRHDTWCLENQYEAKAQTATLLININWVFLGGTSFEFGLKLIMYDICIWNALQNYCWTTLEFHVNLFHAYFSWIERARYKNCSHYDKFTCPLSFFISAWISGSSSDRRSSHYIQRFLNINQFKLKLHKNFIFLWLRSNFFN